MDFKINLDDLAVLLIDMQDYFIQGNRDKINLIPNQISILNFCIDKNIPLMWIEYANCGNTARDLTKTINRFTKKNVYKILKNHDDAFLGTNLHNRLAKLGKKTLLLLGINAHACILATARSAVDYGYTIITSKNLIAGFKPLYQNKSVDEKFKWFIKNGHFFRDHDEIMKNSTRKRLVKRQLPRQGLFKKSTLRSKAKSLFSGK